MAADRQWDAAALSSWAINDLRCAGCCCRRFGRGLRADILVRTALRRAAAHGRRALFGPGGSAGTAVLRLVRSRAALLGQGVEPFHALHPARLGSRRIPAWDRA